MIANHWRLFSKTAAAIVGTALLLPVVIIIGYDIFAFQSRSEEIAKLIQPETSGNYSLPPVFTTLVSKNCSGHTSAVAARFMIEKLHIPYNSGSTLGWNATYALWTALTSVHISEQKQVALIAAYSYMGNGRYGFASESQARFGKPLFKLSPVEAATIVALMHAPSYYETSPEELVKRRDWLLLKQE